MQPIYKGMPELFAYVIGLVERRPQRDIESIVAFNLLRAILNATEHAIIHYFALTLNEPFLQNSHYGSPYLKWAHVTNENFQKVDQQVKSLASIIEHFEDEKTMPPLDPSGIAADSFKKKMHCLHRLMREYACCVVNLDEPFLMVSAISFNGWIETGSEDFASTSGRLIEWPPAVNKSVIPIADRSMLKNIQSVGVERVEKLRQLLTRFAAWLEVNYSMSDITVVPSPKDYFYEHWLVDR